MINLGTSQKKILTSISFVYCITCCIALFTVTPAMDTLYYWDWGRHLALSYFDGPPMVAYVFAAFTYCFGSSIISINALSILSSLIITLPIYALAKKMFDAHVAFFSVWIWLLTLFTFQKYTIGFSYDTPVTFFWALTAYYFYCGFKDRKDRYFYYAGVSAGLMLLSKYTGILLLVSLLILMIFSKPYRKLLKNPAIYGSAIVSWIIVLPVLIWNHKHSGGSLLYQLHHGFVHSMDFKNWAVYLGVLLGNYHLFFIGFIGICILHMKTIFQQENLSFAWFLSVPTLIVFAVIAPFSVKYNWMETFYITSVILIAYYALQTSLRLKLLVGFLFLNAVVLLGFSIGIALEPHKKIVHHRYAQQKNYLQLNQYPFKDYPIFVNNYNDGAGVAFYMKQHPKVFAFTLDAHQYGYWGAPIAQKIMQGTIGLFYLITHAPYQPPAFLVCQEVFKTHAQLDSPSQALMVELCSVRVQNTTK